MMAVKIIKRNGCIVYAAAFTETFAEQLSAAQQTDADAQKIEKRRRERALVYHLINYAAMHHPALALLTGSTIGHTASGAPCFIGSTQRISISHSQRSAAIALSLNGASIGIDIESMSEKISRVADHFLNKDDSECFSGSIEALTAAWAAKEAVYKAAPTDGLTLRQNIILDDFSADCETAASGEGENRTFISARVIDRSGRTALFGVEIIHPFNDTQTLAIATPRGT